MTEKERLNRNPQPEVVRFRLSYFGPEVVAAALELHHVYVLQFLDTMVSVNYAGPVELRHPVLNVPVRVHRFDAPRTGRYVDLQAYPDGMLYTESGGKIPVYQYSGPDS